MLVLFLMFSLLSDLLGVNKTYHILIPCIHVIEFWNIVCKFIMQLFQKLVV